MKRITAAVSECGVVVKIKKDNRREIQTMMLGHIAQCAINVTYIFKNIIRL